MAEEVKTEVEAAKDRLHRLVDSLPDSKLASATTMLEVFVYQSDHPAWAAMRRALSVGEFDDLSETDRAAIREAYAEIEAGAKPLSHEEVERRWREAE